MRGITRNRLSAWRLRLNEGSQRFCVPLGGSSIKTKARENLAVISNFGYVGQAAFTYFWVSPSFPEWERLVGEASQMQVIIGGCQLRSH